MNGENWPLVIGELVEFDNNHLKFNTWGEVLVLLEKSIE